MEADLMPVLSGLGLSDRILKMTQFCAEEDGAPYNVWKIETQDACFVLKKTSVEEKSAYEGFFSGDCGVVPKVFAFFECAGEQYMLMEYVQGDSLSRCDRHRLTLALDALIQLQDAFWEDTAHFGIGYDFAASYPNRSKRLPFMGELQTAYQAYLDAFCRVPRTLCNDDLLPFNVVCSAERAVILDWEYGGILPYPCAIARLLAFGEEKEGALFYMTAQDKTYALDYYYQHLIARKGISREDFDRTMQLFFFKEYSEWVYCAAESGDFSGEYYQKYSGVARQLAKDMGLLPAVIRCVWEHNGSDTLLYAVDYPGAYTRGPSRAIAEQKMYCEIRQYLRWVGEEIPEKMALAVVQDAPCSLDVRDADSDVLFDVEKEALDEEEYSRLKALVLKSAADFQRLFDSVPDPDAFVAAPRDTFYGPVPRTARQMYAHTKNVNAYYFGEIGVAADNEGTIALCRQRGFDALEQIPDFLYNKVTEGSWGESWNLRKLLRRFLWHDRIHARAMYRMARRLFGEEYICDPFGFAR